MKIDIEGLNKVKLVKALYDAAIPTEKTDMNKVITLNDIAYFVNKDRKINVINGKNIKCDIGRDKLSSGVYDRFNGEFAAINAIENLKKQYKEIQLPPLRYLNQAIEYIRTVNPNIVGTNLVYAMFNGHPIYSDNLNVDEIYSRVCANGNKQKEVELDYEKAEKEFQKKISTLTKKYNALAKGVIADDKLDQWYAIVPIRLRDIYHGMELDATLEIIKELNKATDSNNHFAEAKSIFKGQDHSGLSYDLVCAMLNMFAPNGVEFVKYCSDSKEVSLS